MPSLHCRKCSTEIRKQVGLHTLGEPYIESDNEGPYLRCPKCGHENRDLLPQHAGAGEQPDR